MLEAEDLGSPAGGLRRTCLAFLVALRESRRRCSRPSWCWCSLESGVCRLGPKEGLVACNCGGTSSLLSFEDAIDAQLEGIRHFFAHPV
jgi:hypothetical protein